jgi:hypothetical protein
MVDSSSAEYKLTWDLNELVPNVCSDPLSMLSEIADENDEKVLGARTLIPKVGGRTYISCELSKGKRQTLPFEYTEVEDEKFKALENQIKDVAVKYNKTQEEIECLFTEKSYSWEALEEALNVERLREAITELNDQKDTTTEVKKSN